jgi:hypothetical protein
MGLLRSGPSGSKVDVVVYDIYVVEGDIVVVQLALQGTHDGPLRCL